MAQTIKLKRTATPSNVPTTAQLELGEVAINTYDGNVYIKKNDGADAIVKINSNPSDLNYFINGAGTVAGTWLGTDPDITSYYDGLVIWYRITINGAATTTLNINGLGAKTIYRYATAKLTTHWPIGSVIPLVYSTTLNGGSFIGGYDWSDGNESYTVRWSQAAKNGASIIHGYQLLMQGADNLMYPVTVGGVANSTTNVVQTAELRMGGQMLYYNSATDIAANATIGGNILYEGITTAEMEYWSNRNNSTPWATAYLPMYLVGTVNANGNIILDNSTTTAFLTQTLPTTNDGKVYIQVGWTGNTTDNWRLSTHHPVFEFKGGSLRLYQKDGAGSGLDADLLDGQQGSYYYPASNPNGYTNDQTAAEILTAIKTVDGASSGLDADLLDGQQGSYYATAASVAAVAALDPVITLTGAVTGTGTMTNLGNVSIATTATSDPVITLTGAVTGSGTMTNLGNVSITTTNTADPVLTLTGDVTGSATFTNLGNATLTAVVANNSHEHSQLYENSTITYGASYLQWTDLSGTAGTGANGSTPQNPTADWYHHIITNHANGTGYYYDLSLPFHQDELFFRRVTAGAQGAFQKVWHAGNDGSGSGLDADLLDGQQGSYYAPNSSLGNYLPLAGGTLTGNLYSVKEGNNTSGGNVQLGLNSNNTTKWAALTATQYAHSSESEGYSLITGTSGSSAVNTVIIGGGLDEQNAATQVEIRTAVNATTRNGTEIVRISNAAGLDVRNNNIKITGTTVIDSSRNLTNIGTIASTAINTSSSGTVFSGFAKNASFYEVLNAGNTDGAATSPRFYSPASGTAAISAGGAERLRLSSSGATFEGTINAPTFNATSTTNGGFQGIDADTITAPSFTWTSDLDTGMWHSAADAIGFTTGGVNRVTITSTGITAVGDVTAYSDIRLKDNIEVIPNAVSKVQQLRGVTFTRNDVENLEQRHTGVIAQEVEAVLPEAVSEDNAGIKNVAYGNMVGLLIEAIKELKSEVDDLKQQLENK